MGSFPIERSRLALNPVRVEGSKKHAHHLRDVRSLTYRLGQGVHVEIRIVDTESKAPVEAGMAAPR